MPVKELERIHPNVGNVMVVDCLSGQHNPVFAVRALARHGTSPVKNVKDRGNSSRPSPSLAGIAMRLEAFAIRADVAKVAETSSSPVRNVTDQVGSGSRNEANSWDEEQRKRQSTPEYLAKSTSRHAGARNPAAVEHSWPFSSFTCYSVDAHRSSRNDVSE